MSDLLAAADEIGAVWNDEEVVWPRPPGTGLYPGPEWFDDTGRSHIVSMAVEAYDRMKDEHWWATTGPAERPRFPAPRRYMLIAQGIAIGIKIGLSIAERRAEKTTEVVHAERPGTSPVHRARPE